MRIELDARVAVAERLAGRRIDQHSAGSSRITQWRTVWPPVTTTLGGRTEESKPCWAFGYSGPTHADRGSGLAAITRSWVPHALLSYARVMKEILCKRHSLTPAFALASLHQIIINAHRAVLLELRTHTGYFVARCFARRTLWRGGGAGGGSGISTTRCHTAPRSNWTNIPSGV